MKKIFIAAVAALGMYAIIKKKAHVWYPYTDTDKEYEKTEYYRTYEKIKQFEQEWPEYNQKGITLDKDWGYGVIFSKNNEVQAYYQIDKDTFNKLMEDGYINITPLT